MSEIDNDIAEKLDIIKDNCMYWINEEHYDNNIKLLLDCLDLIVLKNRNSCVFYPPIRSKDELYIRNIIREFVPNSYKEQIIMTENEIVNGYRLYDCSTDVFIYADFKEYIKHWQEPNDMTMEEFMKQYNEIACHDWAKIDEHGDSYAGFWRYPDGSIEKENAYKLTLDKNSRCLWKLPYPKKFLLKTIEIGCNNRMESVRYSNFLGEWITRKMKTLVTD